MPVQRFRIRILAACALVVLAGCGAAVPSPPPSPPPPVGGTINVGFGAIPGDAAPTHQRVNYIADLVFTGTEPLKGWHWEATVDPVLTTRVFHSVKTEDPPPNSPDYSAWWYPRTSRHLKGYFDFSSAGMTRQELSSLKAPVIIRLLAADGSEIARFPSR